MSKWILIEIENQEIGNPDAYNTYEEAYREMKERYETVMEDGDNTSIADFYADIQSDLYNINWHIFEVKM